MTKWLRQLTESPRDLAVFWLVSCWLISAQSAFATSVSDIWGANSENSNTFFSVSQLNSSLNLPLSDKPTMVTIPKRQMKVRLEKAGIDNRIEPIQLTISDDDTKILSLVEKISRPQSKLHVASYLKQNFAQGEPIPGTSLRLVNIDSGIYKEIDQDALASLFGKKHHSVTLAGNILKQDNGMSGKLLEQLDPFFSPGELSKIKNKLKDGQNLSLDRDLLPKFARPRIGRHTIYKGPNCFHAALAFQSDVIASSSLVNVRQEPGYHRNMVNYDELWRILQLSFYEVNPTKTPLQYGDMIVFFDTADQKPGQIDFKSLRHAATYLVGGYVFAKGSKSANSPYIVGTLGEEWETWSKYTKKLGLKVFRRSLKNVSKAPPIDPLDWVY